MFTGLNKSEVFQALFTYLSCQFTFRIRRRIKLIIIDKCIIIDKKVALIFSINQKREGKLKKLVLNVEHYIVRSKN